MGEKGGVNENFRIFSAESRIRGLQRPQNARKIMVKQAIYAHANGLFCVLSEFLPERKKALLRAQMGHFAFEGLFEISDRTQKSPFTHANGSFCV